MKDTLYKNILTHLENYKTNSLKITENGIWGSNKKEYSHILPERLYAMNVIDKGYQKGALELLQAKEFHRGFHHLNSSQAVTLNLFAPLVLTNQLALIGNLLKIEIQNSCESKFEYIEDSKEETTFDFFIKGAKQKIYFEIKYTENEFGSAKNDENHQQKYSEIYKDKLNKITQISQEDFFRDYQIWRNIIYSDTGLVVFVFPKFRDDLYDKIELTKKKIKNPENIRILSMEEIVNSCKEKNDLKNHYLEFESKYLKQI